MPSLTPQSNQRLARQHGVISRQQLVEAGVSPSAIARLVARSELIEEHRGVYRVASAPSTEAGRSLAVCLARPDAVIAGTTAGRHWGFRRLPPDARIHVIIPRRAAPIQRPHVRDHRTDVVADGTVIDLPDGRRVLDRGRTAVDLARVLPIDSDLESVLEQAIAHGTQPAAMLDAALPFIGPRRPWAARVARSLGQRIRGGGADSHIEVQIGAALAAQNVVGLVRQHPVVLADGSQIRFDLAIPTIRWALEIDGFPTHFETDGADRDARRDRACAALGWVVRRVTPSEFGSPHEVARRLCAEIAERRRSHSDPPESAPTAA